MNLRSRLVLGAAVAAILTGCGASPSSTPSTSPSVNPMSSPSVTATKTPTGTASATATPTATALGHPVAIGNVMSVAVPVGWQVIRGPVYAPAQNENSVCLHPPGDTRIVFGCAGIAFDYGTHLSGGPGNQPYVPNVQDGWYPATDVQPCPFGPTPSAGQLDGIRPQPGFSQGLRSVGDHHAAWNQWKATCDSGQAFHPQAWFLPKSDVVIFDYIGHSQTNAVLASARFASDGAALPAMPTDLTAHLVSKSANTMIVQPFITYLDNAAGKAYAQAHNLQYPFLDDRLDVETGTQRIVTLDANTACLGNIVLTGQNDHEQPVSCAVFGGHKGLTVGIWWNPATGVAESVSELYRP